MSLVGLAARYVLPLSTALMTLARTASANGDAVTSAAAQVLFDDARRLMMQSRFSEACPKLAESQRLDPTSGTLLNLAICHEKVGKTATAWLEYKNAVALAVRDHKESRRQIAADRIAVLEPRLPKLRVQLPDPLPAKFWLTIDDQSVGVETLHVLVPLDPGVHEVRYGAPPNFSQHTTVELHEGNVSRVVVLPPHPQPPSTVVQRTPSSAGPDWILAGVGLGVAAAAFGSLAYFGVRASNEWDTRNEHCVGGCDATAVGAGQSAQRFALAADVALGIGVLGSAVGGYFLVKALRSPLDVTASAGRSALTLSVRWQM